MGVPRFFYWITQRYPCLYRIATAENFPTFDYFYIDLNSIIHVCSHGLHAGDKMSDINRYERIAHSIDSLCKMVRPRKFLFLAVDGVGPAAKIAQQRQRRFKKIQEEKNDISEDPFDSNCISPGTNFMIELDSYLSQYIRQKISNDCVWKSFQVYYSGVRVPGEGEHKIMDFIRNSSYDKNSLESKYFTSGTHLVHGNDADLIFLGLGLKIEKICILKTDDQIKGSCTPRHLIVYISLLKDYIDEEFKDIKTKINFTYHLDSVINDWILLSFLVGNDFLPPLPFLYISSNSLALLWVVYKSVLPKIDGYIVENASINIDRLKIFIKELSQYEILHFRNAQLDDNWSSKKKKTSSVQTYSKSYVFSSEADLDQKICNDELEIDKIREGDNGSGASSFGPTLPLQNNELFSDEEPECCAIKPHEQIPYESYKADYYTLKLKIDSDDCESLKDICHEYIRGLEWIIRYYLKGIPSWSWAYPYHYSPLISDLVNNIPLNVELQLDQPCKPFTQLVCIMPKESYAQLPKDIQSCLNDPCNELVDMYPTNFLCDQLWKIKDYESIVLIPFPDIMRVTSFVEKVIQNMTIEDLRNNQFNISYVFEYIRDGIAYMPADHSTDELNEHKTNIAPNIRILELKTLSIVPSLQIQPSYPQMPHASFKYIPNDCIVKAKSSKYRVQIYMERVIDTKKTTEVDVIKLISKLFCANFPFGTLAISDQFYDLSNKYSIVKQIEDNNIVYSINREKIDDEKIFDIINICDKYRKMYYDDYKIVIPQIKFLISAKPLVGLKYEHGTKRIKVKRHWSDQSYLIPFELCYPVSKEYTKSYIPKLEIEELFKPGELAVSIDPKYYGHISKLISFNPNAITAKTEICLESHLELNNLEFLKKPLYHSFYESSVAYSMLGIEQNVFNRVTGSVIVKNYKYAKNFSDVGLNLRSNKFNMEVIGYSKTSDNKYFYSQEALKLIQEYLTTFPCLLKLLRNFQRSERYIYEYDFKLVDDESIIYCINTWLTDHNIHGLLRCYNGVQYIDTSSITEMLESPHVQEVRRISSQPINSLYSLNSCFSTVSIISPLPKNLLDYVLCLHVGENSPFMQYGIITAIFSKKEFASTEIDMCEVLLMNECSNMKIYRANTNRLVYVPSSWLMNISQARLHFPALLPNSWENALTANIVEPSNKIIHNYEVQIPSSGGSRYDVEYNTRQDFTNTIRNLVVNPKREVLETLKVEKVKIEPVDQFEAVERLKSLCQSVFNVDLSFDVKIIDSKYVCDVKVGDKIYNGSESICLETAIINSANATYYSLKLQLNNGRQ